MPGHVVIFLWLLAGGLLCVAVGLGVVCVLLWRLRRELQHNATIAAQGLAAPPSNAPRDAISEEDIAAVLRAARSAAHSPAAPYAAAMSDAIPADAIAAALCEEWATFQAVYRADLAQIMAEIRSADAPRAPSPPREGRNRLDDAIALASAGHDAETLMRMCDLDHADAEALVRFHGSARLT